IVTTDSFASVSIDGGAGDIGLFATAAKWGVLARATGPVGIGVSGGSDGGLFGVGGEGANGAIGVGGHSPDGIGAYASGESPAPTALSAAPSTPAACPRTPPPSASP